MTICIVSALTILFYISIKLFIYPDQVKKLLNDHIVLSSFATYPMALSSVANITYKYSTKLALFFWWLSLLLAIVILIQFIRIIISNKLLDQIIPTWFIPFLSFSLIALNSLVAYISTLAYVMFYFSLLSYFILLPLVLNKLIKQRNIPNNIRPTYIIMLAPPSLLFQTYFTLYVNEWHKSIAIGFLTLIIISLLFSLLHLLKLNFKQFYPTLAAITFPFAVATLALRSQSIIFGLENVYLVTFIINLMMFLAIFTTVLSTIKYITYIKWRGFS